MAASRMKTNVIALTGLANEPVPTAFLIQTAKLLKEAVLLLPQIHF